MAAEPIVVPARAGAAQGDRVCVGQLWQAGDDSVLEVVEPPVEMVTARLAGDTAAPLLSVKLEDLGQQYRLVLDPRDAEILRLERRLDVLHEAVMRLRPALRNGEIEQAVEQLQEVARGR
jgi:hypothetical protein